jgi:esterase FrsA
MNDVEELKRFAVTHAKAQNISGYRELLGRIRHDDGNAPGSWVWEWSQRAEQWYRRGRFLHAARHFTMARFPFVDGVPRQTALDRCVTSFGQWARERGIERLDLALPEGNVRCWAAGLSTTERRPLVLMSGGIVSGKEQWAAALPAMARLGLAGVVIELPGVGENTLPYDQHSWRMISGILDALADRADVRATYALMFSFSGHLALRCAVADPRIRGVVTACAPIAAFFTDTEWQARLPRVTVDTLAHLIGVDSRELPGTLAPWALCPEQLAALDIPLAYAASTRDEIIPPADRRLLSAHVRRLDLVEHDDVHGSPRHVLENRLWSVRAVLRMQGARTALTWALGSGLGLLRARRGLGGGNGHDPYRSSSA